MSAKKAPGVRRTRLRSFEYTIPLDVSHSAIAATAQMAYAIMGGLAVATVLTLVFLPDQEARFGHEVAHALR